MFSLLIELYIDYLEGSNYELSYWDCLSEILTDGMGALDVDIVLCRVLFMDCIEGESLICMLIC